MTRIETGVDRLVELINQEKKISIDDAAKKLGISKIVIQEWADFLEEEKIISIEYKFNKTFLVERKLTQEEIKIKEKEYSSERDAFVRKIESSLKTLESDSLGFERIKSEFDELKKGVGSELEKVKSEVQQLEKYEYLKKNLDTDIENQVAEFHQVLDQAHKEIEKEQRRHLELIEALEIQKRELQVKEHRLLSLEEKEKELMTRVQSIFDLTKDLDKSIQSERTSISAARNQIYELQNAIKDIERTVLKKRESIQPLLDKAKKHEDQILKLQQDILNKARAKTSEIEGEVVKSNKVVQKFEKFFEKKAEVENLIQQIEDEKTELENDFENLKKKALAFNLASKTDTSTHLKELESNLDNINKKKSKLKEDLEKLIRLIKG